MNLNAHPHNGTLMRDVHRAGWLKYVPFADKSSTEDHRFWVVFTVLNDREPYLEFYGERQSLHSLSSAASLQSPVSTHSLSGCRHVSPAIVTSSNEHEFRITLETHVIRLVADSYQLMCDWVESIKGKLKTLKVLDSGDNLYSKDPQTITGLSFRRSSNLSLRPLPPIPSSSSTDDNHEVYEPIFDMTLIQRLSEPISDGPSDEGPPPYTALGSTQLMSLRESQVMRLKREIRHLPGVRLMIRKKDCYDAIALIDYKGFVYISGWKQKDHPLLHNTFHIGDRILTIADQSVTTANEAYRIIKHQSLVILEFIVQRIPFGMVFCFKRDYDGHDLGIIRDGNSGLIKDVIPDGIADKHGLASRTDSGDLWFITEINNRPLNLFFKGTEIYERLNSAGKEITILVQPQHFVKHLKKHLKSFRSYKEYIVQ